MIGAFNVRHGDVSRASHGTNAGFDIQDRSRISDEIFVDSFPVTNAKARRTIFNHDDGNRATPRARSFAYTIGFELFDTLVEIFMSSRVCTLGWVINPKCSWLEGNIYFHSCSFSEFAQNKREDCSTSGFKKRLLTAFIGPT